jgi:hypothetical protein
MRREKEQEDVEKAETAEEPEKKYIAYWSDQGGGGSQPSPLRFHTREQVVRYLQSRLANLDQVYQNTRAQYRIETARVMREATTKMIRKFKSEQNLAAYEANPVNISATLAKYCDAHRMPTGDQVERKPVEPPKLEEANFLEGE